MSRAISVRAVRAGDAAALRALRLRALTESPDAFGTGAAQEARLPPAHWAELAAQAELADHLAIYVAVEGEGWLGMGAGRWADRERGVAQLWGMWVDPAARGQRVGERLVLEVRRWAAGHGARFLRLGVVVRDGDATGFYERLGFVATGEVQPLRRDRTLTARYLVRPV